MSTHLEDVIMYGLFSARPAAGEVGALYFASDTGAIYRDNGATWDDVTPPAGIGTVTHTGGALTADLPIFGAGTDDVAVGTRTGNTTKVASASGTFTSTHGVVIDASGNLVDSGGAPAGGSVSSVAMTVPTEFAIAGSPVTSSGTLAVTKQNQNANLVYAGPTTGSAAAPTFRALVLADLPSGQPYDLNCALVGKPEAAAIVFIFTAVRAVTLAANFAGSYGSVGTNPTSTADYTVKNGATTIGTVSISTSGVFTFTTVSGTSKSLAAGDRVTITAPTSQDATLSDVGFTLVGTR